MDAGARSLITQQVRDALRLGEVAGEFVYAVTAADVERFARATGEVDGPWVSPSGYEGGALPDGTPAPLTFYAALDPVERRDLLVEAYLDDIPYVMTGGGNAFNEVRYERPICVGDTITVSTTFTEVYERDGRSGRLLFRVRENRYCDERGAPVAWTRCGHVRAYDLSRTRGSCP